MTVIVTTSVVVVGLIIITGLVVVTVICTRNARRNTENRSDVFPHTKEEG